MSDVKGREFQIAEQVAELLDTLKTEQQRQIMAMLATRYGLKLLEPTKPSVGSYRPSPKRRY